MPELQQKPENIWKKLTRLFRSGPIVRHKVAAGEKLNEPRGTARAYKKELSSLYVHSLASYGQYERLARYADYCFHPDTVVYTTRGSFTLKELSEKYGPGERFNVYSYDYSQKKVVIAEAHSSRLKREGIEQDLFEIVLDDGGSVKVTGDHQVALRDGTRKRADELIPGDRLMPFYKKDLMGQGYQWIYTMDRSRSSNGWELEHRIVAEHVLGRCLSDEEVVHHQDFVRGNNIPENLRVMLDSDHTSYHATLNNKNKKGKPNQRHSDWMKKGGSHRREDVNIDAIVRAAIATDFNLSAVVCLLKTDRTAVKLRLRERGFNNWKHFQSRRIDIEKGITLEVVKRESSATWEQVLENHVGCNTIYELSCKVGCTEKSIMRRVVAHGYSNWTDFKQKTDSLYDPKRRYSEGAQEPGYQNHQVIEVRPAGKSEVYNITVEEHHNLAAGSWVIDVEGKSKLSACFYWQSEMEFTPEIAAGLNIFSDESSSEDEDGKTIKIVTKNQEIKGILETLFFDILNIDFNLWSWTRNLCKYGDFVLFVDASESNGILNLLPIPINEIEREEGYDKEDPFAVRFRWLTQGNMVLENWQIVHFRLLGNDNFLPYGSSMIEPARRIWRQLILIEDAMLVYRIVRSPERRVFYIDVGNVAPAEIETFMEQIKTRLRRTQVVDPNTGRVDLRYNPLSVDEDYFIPTRGDKSSKIETLAGGQFTGDIDDVQYIQNKLFAALTIPKAYLSFEGDIGSKATLSQQDVRFSRTIGRIQKILIAELNKIAIIHLYLLGYRDSDLVDFEIKMANPSSIALQQQLELWRLKFEIAGSATEGMLDRRTVYKKIFNLSDEEIEEVMEGKRADKLEDLTLEAMQLPQEDQPAGPEGGAPGGGEAVPGEGELPTTLGGEPGGAPPAGGGEGAPEEGANKAGGMGAGELVEEAPETPPEKKDRDWGLQCKSCGHEYPWNTAFDPSKADCCANPSVGFRKLEVDEKRNRGSEGNNAAIGGKGHKLSNPHQDMHAHVFGTKKQTASDPNDRRALRRLVTRPFSDSVVRRADRAIEELMYKEGRGFEHLVESMFQKDVRKNDELQESVREILTRVRDLGTEK